MSLLTQSLLVFVVTFIGYMHSYWGSTMCNRPIIVSTLIGIVFGDLQTGLVVGAALELAFLGAVPIGASNPPDMTSGAAVATAIVITTGADNGMAVAIAIPVATLVALFDNLQMMFLLTYAGHMCDKAAEEADADKVERIVRIASIGNKVLLALVVAIGYYLGSTAITDFIEWVPEWFSHGMDVVAGILPALGIAMLAKMMVAKDNFGYLILGFVISAYLGVPTFGVALAGTALAIILFFREQKTTEKEEEIDDNEF